MSRVVDSWEYGGDEYELGDMVWFDYAGIRLYGEVVRVYATRTNFHVEVDGVRYSVNLTSDNMSRSK